MASSGEGGKSRPATKAKAPKADQAQKKRSAKNTDAEKNAPSSFGFMAGLVSAFILIAVVIGGVIGVPAIRDKAHALMALAGIQVVPIATSPPVTPPAPIALPVAVMPPVSPALNARIAALETALAAIQQRALTPAATPAPVSATSNADMILFAFIYALDQGRPFGALEPQVRTVIAPDFVSRLDALMPFAEKGIPGVLMLWRNLGTLAANELKDDLAKTPAKPAHKPAASMAEGTPTGLWGRIKARLKGMVNVRRIGEIKKPGNTAKPSDAPGIHGSLDAILQRFGPSGPGGTVGDLARALHLADSVDISSLKDGGAFDQWRSAARARINAASLAEELGGALMMLKKSQHPTTPSTPQP
ncbi:MAG: hypothetical protein HOF95_04395 [Rhodospirillales bacterium]|jgi:hypothetical protein|nr:hypothetical protein [Rhodospirillales bacterium]MBT4005885.1 hypothetical protein [Rhodospirillales bacterium]MBT5077070.1 hypothetical protein [Rhodospirillales bacterium]MBT5112594.1 hypothetical protein [Rhodospirillales bacterium]MBT5672118.1 hypothetical protein [Rhodospirillales bacterium]